MVILLILAALILWALVSVVIEVRRDGHRAVPTDRARVADLDPVPPRAPATPLTRPSRRSTAAVAAPPLRSTS